MALNQLPKQKAIKDQHLTLDSFKKKVRCHKLLISDGQELKYVAKFSFYTLQNSRVMRLKKSEILVKRTS